MFRKVPPPLLLLFLPPPLFYSPPLFPPPARPPPDAVLAPFFFPPLFPFCYSVAGEGPSTRLLQPCDSQSHCGKLVFPIRPPPSALFTLSSVSGLSFFYLDSLPLLDLFHSSFFWPSEKHPDFFFFFEARHGASRFRVIPSIFLTKAPFVKSAHFA